MPHIFDGQEELMNGASEALFDMEKNANKLAENFLDGEAKLGKDVKR